MRIVSQIHCQRMFGCISKTFRVFKTWKVCVNPRFLIPYFFLSSGILSAQSAGIPLHAPTYHILERLEILSGQQSPIHPELKFFPRQDAADYAVALDTQAGNLSRRDRADLQYIFDDNNDCVTDTGLCRHNQKGLFGVFYKTPANLFEVNAKDFSLRVNPMFNFHIGQQKDDPELTFINQRGLEVRGSVDDKLFFYSSLVESQARFADHVTKRVEAFQAIPYAGNFKHYTPRLLDITDAYDYNQASAYISFKATKHVGIQLGHGKHFIGNGYRSLFLSDFSNYAFYLKLNTRVWRFHYQNLFLELSPLGANNSPGSNERIPKKYIAAHYLNYRITPKLAVGLFEATVFNRSQQFEFQYLNPLILYRTVEGMIGSPDNVLVGFDARWNFLNRFQLYSQFMLDEFLFSALVKPEEKGWWGNKYGFQAGLKYINAFGIDHLDMQAEYNIVRPYTYSHADSLNAYTHYNQPLAHPLLSNFKEIVALLRYQPLPRLSLSARYVHAETGENTDTENWGANPLLGYGSRVQDFGNFTGQGVAATIDIFGLDASWMLYHNLFVDLKILLRKKDSADDTRDLNTNVFGVGLRMNIWNENLDF